MQPAKNSHRIQRFLFNQNLPNYKEVNQNYKNEYNQILKSTANPLKAKRTKRPLILFFLFGAAFSITVKIDAPAFGWAIIIMGIINAVILFMRLDDMPIGEERILNDPKAAKRLQELDEKYEKLGYVFDDFNSLYSNYGKCGDFDQSTGRYQCSADLCPLSEEQAKWCQTAGNCLKCEKLNHLLLHNDD